MKLINRTSILSMVVALTDMGSQAADAGLFPEQSVLSEGKWVKIHIGSTGIYELSDAELMAMGFAHPEAIGIYGRGGALQPTQFAAAKGESYVSDLQPVALKRKDGKTYFYAQGSQKIRYIHENDSEADAQRFERESNQAFCDDVVYFITDTPRERKQTEEVKTGTCNAALPALQEAWAYSRHEADTYTFMPYGREFFGESFVKEEARTQLIPYSIPRAVAGSEASITCVFAARSAMASTLELGFEGGAVATTTLRAVTEGDNYTYGAKRFFTLPITEPEGNVRITYTPGDSNAEFAGLDYFIVGARRKLEFAEGESQFTVYPYEFAQDKYSRMEMAQGSVNVGVWQVTGSGSVKELFTQSGEGVTEVLYADDHHTGPVVFVDYTREQLKIKGFEQVQNQNLHSLGLANMPSMVIITLPALEEAAQQIAQVHKDKEGIEVAVVLHEQVVNEFSAGVADPMAYRALAKMLYDRDDPERRVFKNLLLLGPNVRDQRNILGLIPEIGTLISNQVYTANDADYTFCLNDWYGMMEDRTRYEQTSKFFYEVPMHIGVGIIPVNDAATASAMARKVARFYADDSFAYWLSDYNYVADGGNDNEHLEWEEALWKSMGSHTKSAGFGVKIYKSLTEGWGMRDMFAKRVREGSLISYYTGHASNDYIGTNFIGPGDERRFRNSRYGIFLIGACDLSQFDNNKEGVGTRQLTQTDGGFVAVLTSSRAGYSRHNYTLLDLMQTCLHCEDAAGQKPLAEGRTIGEAYAMAKTAADNHYNKYVFHLLGDPAIVLPMPTAEVTAVMEAAADGVYPGSEMKISGKVLDRTGQLLEDFNGTVVAKLCGPAEGLATTAVSDAASVNVQLDQTTLHVTAFDVKGGEFEGTVFIPKNIPASAAAGVCRLRFSAYDAATRRGAAGALELNVKEYDAEKAVASDLPPEIESMYANSPETSEQDAVPASFMLHAELTDDYGVMAYDISGMPSLCMTIDGKQTKTDLNSHITVSENGKRVHIAYPVSGMSVGAHVLRLTGCDANGQTASRNLNVKVGGINGSFPLTLEPEGPARETVTISMEAPGAEDTAGLRIFDACGRLVLHAAMEEGSFKWDLRDKDGNRVPAGIYYAISVRSNTRTGAAVSAPREIIVFN